MKSCFANSKVLRIAFTHFLQVCMRKTSSSQMLVRMVESAAQTAVLRYCGCTACTEYASSVQAGVCGTVVLWYCRQRILRMRVSTAVTCCGKLAGQALPTRPRSLPRRLAIHRSGQAGSGRHGAIIHDLVRQDLSDMM